MGREVKKPENTTISRRTLLGAGIGLLALSGCNSDTEAPKTSAGILRKIGIERGPAIVYLSYDGCAPESSPHNYRHIQTITEQLSGKSELPTKLYALDVDYDFLNSEKRLRYQDTSTQLPYPQNLRTVPGEYKSLNISDASKSTVTSNLRILGFPVNDNDLRNHSGNLLLFDSNLKRISVSPSKDNPALTIEKFAKALMPSIAITHTR